MQAHATMTEDDVYSALLNFKWLDLGGARDEGAESSGSSGSNDDDEAYYGDTLGREVAEDVLSAPSFFSKPPNKQVVPAVIVHDESDPAPDPASASAPVPEYRGVRLMQDGWRARVRGCGRRVAMGPFESAEAAARAYDEMAKRFHGDQAILNFNDDGSRNLRAKTTPYEQHHRQRRVAGAIILAASSSSKHLHIIPDDPPRKAPSQSPSSSTIGSKRQHTTTANDDNLPAHKSRGSTWAEVAASPAAAAPPAAAASSTSASHQSTSSSNLELRPRLREAVLRLLTSQLLTGPHPKKRRVLNNAISSLNQRNEVLEAVLCTLLASTRQAAMDAGADLTDRLMLASAVMGMVVEEY